MIALMFFALLGVTNQPVSFERLGFSLVPPQGWLMEEKFGNVLFSAPEGSTSFEVTRTICALQSCHTDPYGYWDDYVRTMDRTHTQLDHIQMGIPFKNGVMPVEFDVIDHARTSKHIVGILTSADAVVLFDGEIDPFYYATDIEKIHQTMESFTLDK